MNRALSKYSTFWVSDLSRFFTALSWIMLRVWAVRHYLQGWQLGSKGRFRQEINLVIGKFDLFNYQFWLYFRVRSHRCSKGILICTAVDFFFAYQRGGCWRAGKKLLNLVLISASQLKFWVFRNFQLWLCIPTFLSYFDWLSKSFWVSVWYAHSNCLFQFKIV